jgi:hypothetical protein
MSLEVDYLPVATAAGNNADSQANFQGSSYQQLGFVNGIAQPFQFNKILRQTSMVAAAVANFIANQLNIAVIDDGNLAGLITNLTSAIKSLVSSATTGVVSVPFSPTPVFDASQGTVFEIVLTGNVTSSTLVNITPGQSLKFIIKQDATGGHAFVPPANLPMVRIASSGATVSIQEFIVDGGSTVYVTTAMAVTD